MMMRFTSLALSATTILAIQADATMPSSRIVIALALLVGHEQSAAVPTAPTALVAATEGQTPGSCDPLMAADPTDLDLSVSEVINPAIKWLGNLGYSIPSLQAKPTVALWQICQKENEKAAAMAREAADKAAHEAAEAAKAAKEAARIEAAKETPGGSCVVDKLRVLSWEQVADSSPEEVRNAVIDGLNKAGAGSISSLQGKSTADLEGVCDGLKPALSDFCVEVEACAGASVHSASVHSLGQKNVELEATVSKLEANFARQQAEMAKLQKMVQKMLSK